MFIALAAAAALSLAPAQPAGVQLTNVRMTAGELGPTRKETKFLPGDLLYIAYEIDGITIDADGATKYEQSMEVTDAAGKLMFRQEPTPQELLVLLRGGKVPGRTFITIGIDQPAGTYTCKTTVTDSKTKSSNSLSMKFEVVKPEFGIVAVNPTFDQNGALSAPTTGVVGQNLFIHFQVATFQRDAKTKQPNVELLFDVLDDKGKPTLGKPVKFVQETGVAQDLKMFHLYFPLYLSRPGKFSVRISATDKVANKKASYELPVTVLAAN
ncbi:MAG TPA: hypothetical protein VN641_11650 [Urbifossiella sp.]|nr:hypothetical protein [Urbifossiella sp.]